MSSIGSDSLSDCWAKKKTPTHMVGVFYTVTRGDNYSAAIVSFVNVPV